MKGKLYLILFSLYFAFLPVQVFPEDDVSAEDKIISVDGTVIAGIASLKPIERDSAFDVFLQKRISGTGAVLSFDKTRRYGRNLRLLLSASEIPDSRLTVIYSIFLDNEETASLLVTGDEFSFTGKLEAVTPCSTGRTVYMLDVVIDGGEKTEKDK